MALSRSSGATRLHWDAERGWVADVVSAMPMGALRRIAELALPTQRQRFHGLPPGARKDQLKSAIEALERTARATSAPLLEITQRIVGERGDGSGDLRLFTAGKRGLGDEPDTKIIDLGRGRA